MIYEFEGKSPIFYGDNHYIADSAVVIGSVIIENNVCILPGAIIRADNDVIHIGEGSNIQDGAVLHTDPGIKFNCNQYPKRQIKRNFSLE